MLSIVTIGVSCELLRKYILEYNLFKGEFVDPYDCAKMWMRKFSDGVCVCVRWLVRQRQTLSVASWLIFLFMNLWAYFIAYKHWLRIEYVLKTLSSVNFVWLEIRSILWKTYCFCFQNHKSCPVNLCQRISYRACTQYSTIFRYCSSQHTKLMNENRWRP